MSAFVTLENVVEEELKIYSPESGEWEKLGKRGTPQALRTMTKEEAQEFIDVHGAKVRIFRPENRILDKVVKVEVSEVWIANMTGNPDAPDEVYGMGYNDKGQIISDVLEPYLAKQPRDIIAPNVGTKQVEMESPSDAGSIFIRKTIPGRTLRLEPLSRMKLLTHEAKSFLDAEYLRGDEQGGAVMVSRPQAEWEPQWSWDHMSLRFYLEMLPEGGRNFPAGRLVLGPTPDEIKSSMVGKPQRDVLKALHDAKMLLWTRIALRLMNPAIPLPTQEQYNRFVGKRKDEASEVTPPTKASKAEINDLLKKHGA